MVFLYQRLMFYHFIFCYVMNNFNFIVYGEGYDINQFRNVSINDGNMYLINITL